MVPENHWLLREHVPCSMPRFNCGTVYTVQCTYRACTVFLFDKPICVDSRETVYILASKSVPLTLTTVQVPNLELTHTKRITVWDIRTHTFSQLCWVEGFYFYLFTHTYKGDSDIPAPGEGLTLTQEPREHCCVTRSHINVQMLSWNGAGWTYFKQCDFYVPRCVLHW